MISALADEAAKVHRILELRRQWFAERASTHGTYAGQLMGVRYPWDSDTITASAYTHAREAGHYGRRYLELTADPMSEAARG